MLIKFGKGPMLQDKNTSKEVKKQNGEKTYHFFHLQGELSIVEIIKFISGYSTSQLCSATEGF